MHDILLCTPGTISHRSIEMSTTNTTTMPATAGTQKAENGTAPVRYDWFDPWTTAPFSVMRRMTDEMGRFLDGFHWGLIDSPFSNESREMLRTFGQRWPEVEVVEREGKVIVRADLPGINKEDVTVEMTDDGIVLKGERRQAHEEKRDGYYRSERSYGSFYRAIPLPGEITPESAEATFKDGVLEVTVKGSEKKALGRTVEIK